MTLRPEGLPGGVVFHQTDDPVIGVGRMRK